MGLDGIDISFWQDVLVVSSMTTCDFIIVKATGGAGYKNECFERHANDTLTSGNLLDCFSAVCEAWELELAGSACDDLITRYSWTGGIDGAPGDQTGRESWTHNYYSGHWDGILHYNGKADVGSASVPTSSGAPSGDMSEFAARVIAGDLGNGEERKRRLEFYYSIVQSRVNEMLP